MSLAGTFRHGASNNRVAAVICHVESPFLNPDS